MLTSLVCFTFAYGSMLRVLLPAACGRRLLVRLRSALLALSDFPAAAAIGCMNITGDATFGDRSEFLPHSGARAQRASSSPPSFQGHAVDARFFSPPSRHSAPLRCAEREGESARPSGEGRL